MFTPTDDEALVFENRPVNLEATRKQLKKAQIRLERYQAALRLANTEIERRNRDLLALTTFTYQASRTASMVGLLKLALVQAMVTANTSVGAIVLVDKETKELMLGVHKGLTSELTKILTGQQLGNGAVSLMPHLVTGSGALLEYHNSEDKMEKLLLHVSRLTSLVSLPLQLGPRLVGAFLVGLQEKRAFAPAELCFLMVLSQELAIALESVRLREGLWLTAEALMGGELDSVDLEHIDDAKLNLQIPTPFELPTAASTTSVPAGDDLEHLLAAMMEAEDEVKQHNADLQTLNTIADIMNRTLNIKEILQSAVDQTMKTLDADAAWLYLVDAERNQLEMRAHTGLSEAYVRGMQLLKVGRREIEGQTAADGKAHFIDSVAKDYPRHKIWVDGEKLHAIAAIPIICPDFSTQTGQTGSHVIGVLAVGKKDVQSHRWSPREGRLLTSISNQLALAINNAQLYAQVQEHEVGLRAGNEVLRTVNDMLLEKNAFLEGYIQDDLIPALTVASPVLKHLLAEAVYTLTDTQKQDMATLQKVIAQLNNLAKETGDISKVLDNVVDDALDDEDKANAAGPTKPLRLEKKHSEQPESIDIEQFDNIEVTATDFERDDDTQPAAKDVQPSDETDSKPMSFEEAVAAGLVPPHILDRE